ncbi:MAG: prepilin-type N-terminal cleavage/methylation domain-containing protein [Clostridiales bacterium]|nr:prepilin-type N-terminal cleavage/methylation domain-containing protein [Clostridiales bacterium]
MRSILNKKGFTLLELILVIAIIAVLAAVAVPVYSNIKEQSKDNVDLYNSKLVADVVNRGLLDGVLEVRALNGNQLYNTVSNRAYVGTGSWFFEDMNDYIYTRVEPIGQESGNDNNTDPGDSLQKFFFDIDDDTIYVYYNDADNSKVYLDSILYTNN